jgi:GDPmannose 4,6-dehydratase
VHAPQCRFYSAGSSEQWGDVAYSPQDEKHPLRPRSPYGAAKCAAAHLVKVYRESFGLYAVHGILFNHESERRGEEFVTRKITLGVARIARAVKDGQPFEPIELGNLDAKRDWSHAEDFVEGIWRMVNQVAPAENVAEVSIGGKVVEGLTPLVLGWEPQEYVLASGETHTVREFVEKAFAAAGFQGAFWDREEPIAERGHLETYEWINTATNTGHTLVGQNPAFLRPAEVELLLGNATRARTELGWTPKVSFDELVTRMVRSDLAAVGL